MISLEHIKKTLVTAENWFRKKQPAHAQFCLEGAIKDYLSLAVLQFDAADDAAKWFRGNAVDELLERCRQNLTVLCGEVDAGRLPNSVIAGNYNYLVFSALASCLDLFEINEWFTRVAARPDVLELSTPFWCEYSRGASALVERQAYRVGEFKRLRRMERYWLPYLQLMSAASLNEPLGPALEAIRESFTKRNSDKRLVDPNPIDGTGDEPVRWDFRRDGLLAYISYMRSE